MQRSSAEHWELIAAFKTFDADLAAKIILKHGERSQTNLLGRMQRKRAEMAAESRQPQAAARPGYATIP